MHLEINRNSTKPISNHWITEDNNRNHYIHKSTTIETLQSSYIVTSYLQKKERNVIFSDGILKTLSMRQFNSFVKEVEVYLIYQTTAVIQGNNYHAVATHVGTNDLLSSNKSVNDICRDTVSIGLTQ